MVYVPKQSHMYITNGSPWVVMVLAPPWIIAFPICTWCQVNTAPLIHEAHDTSVTSAGDSTLQSKHTVQNSDTKEMC